jgi:flavin-dependent dehydrogenase
MQEAYDLAILGGGPAGAAAGIVARDKGMRVVLFDRAPEPTQRPGETLHPGAAVLFERLGVADSIGKLAGLRPHQIETRWANYRSLDPYGNDHRGVWRGYQISRAELDRALLHRFTELGGEIVRPVANLAPIVENDGHITGIAFGGGRTSTSMAIDATGQRCIFQRTLDLVRRRISPPLVATYGYVAGDFGPTPLFEGGAEGWAWIAQVQPNQIAWVRLSFGGEVQLDPPRQIAQLPPISKSGAADVSWRIAEQLAGRGWFLAGDAACSLDPAGSHGVLRALMSGMMAGEYAANVIGGRLCHERAARSYSSWLQSWFQQDVARLLALYTSAGAEWARLITTSSNHEIRRAAYV